MNTVEKIMFLLESKKLEQKDLANFLGVRPQTISDWKSGKTQSYNKYIEQIASFFDVSVDYLLGRTGETGCEFMTNIINLKPIITRIEKMCENNNLSVDKMLKDSQAGASTIANMKKGSAPSIDKIIAIANYFNCSVDYILCMTDKASRYNINNVDTTVSGTQANVIHKEDDYNLNEVKNVLNQLSKANQLRAVADILDLIEEKYLNK